VERRDGERRPEQQQQPQRREERGDRGRRDQQQAQGSQRERRPDGPQQRNQPSQQQQRPEQSPKPEPAPRVEPAAATAAQGQPGTALIPLPAVVAEASAGASSPGDDANGAPRPDRPARTEGERSGRRSRRGGRRRRRDSGEVGPGQDGAAEAAGPESGGDLGAPEPQSFDFERTTPVEFQPQRPAEPSPQPSPPAFTPPPAPEPRPEWTPAPPSDATREGPRSEP